MIGATRSASAGPGAQRFGDRPLHLARLDQGKLRSARANPNLVHVEEPSWKIAHACVGCYSSLRCRLQPTLALTVLGIETSCDETAAGVVRRDADGRVEVLSSIVLSQVKDHAPFGGVVPEIAARAHVEAIDAVIKAAMTKAGLGFGDLDGVAATAGPGLVGGVMVGLSAGKAIALARGLPLIAVNHLEGHALSARLAADVAYPYLLLLISGGHCQLLDVEGVGRCTRLGSTIDDAAGEAFDKIAKALGLPYPGGPALEVLAIGGDASRYSLPRALLGRAGCDFSFSGLKTAAARLAETVRGDIDRRDLAAAVQGAIARQLADRSERAMGVYAEAHSPGRTDAAATKFPSPPRGGV